MRDSAEDMTEETGRVTLNDMKPISLEVVANVPTTLTSCRSCTLIFKDAGVEDEVNKEILQEYPEALRDEYVHLSNWIREISALYKDSVCIRIIDAASMAGLFKAVRYWFRTYPAFIVDRKHVISGWDRKRLREILDAHVRRISPQRSHTTSVDCASGGDVLHFFDKNRHI